MNWNYEPPKKKFERIPDGNYRLKIISVEPKPETSESENDYVIFKYKVSGQDATALSYLTFNKKDPELTNYLISLMADSFGVNYNEIDVNDFSNWIGHYGAGTIKKSGRFKSNRVIWFIKANDQYYLPAWVDGKVIESDEIDDELPW